MGRKKGGKNKSKLSDEALAIKQETNIMVNPKEIKKEIRALKKLKIACRAGTKERIDLHRQIKDLKNKLIDFNKPEPEKEPIIAEILKIETERKTIPTFAELFIDLHKYTLTELQKHLDLLTKKGGEK